MHDKNGKPVKKGDTVTLTGKVTQTHAGAETCNITVQDETGESYCFTAAKVEVTESAAESDQATSTELTSDNPTA